MKRPCPGGGELPQSLWGEAGRCSGCGVFWKLRRDGRVRKHPAPKPTEPAGAVDSRQGEDGQADLREERRR
jgi:hypothetical protein